MKTKFVALFSAMLLLSACETTSTADGGAGGSGAAGGSGTAGYAQNYLDDAKTVSDRVFFAFDSSVLTSEGQRTLERQAAWLQDNSGSAISIEGHCDERGTREYNLALGERRAAAAKNYLVSLGVSAGRISTVSYGKERPAVVGSNEAAWAQNRRAVTVLGN